MSTTAIKAHTVKLEMDISGRLQQLAHARHRSAHSLMKEAIQQYIDREEKRDIFLHDAKMALDRYLETGLHATAEEVEAWFTRLEQGDDQDPPECHK